MKNAKRIIAFVLAVLMLLALSACTGTTEPDVTNEETTVVDNETEKTTDAEETKVVIPETKGETTVTETEPSITTEQTETTIIEEPTNEYEIYSIGDFYAQRALLHTSVGYGYIDTDGHVVVEPIYEEAYDYSIEAGRAYPRALVKLNGKYGYIDHLGAEVVEIKYDKAEREFKGLTIVSLDGITYYINKHGEVIYTVTGKEVEIGDFSNGYMWVQLKEEHLYGTRYYIEFYNQHGYVMGGYDQSPHKYNNVDYGSVNEYGYAFVNEINENNELLILKFLPNDFERWGIIPDNNGSNYSIAGFTPINKNYLMCEYGWNQASYYYLDFETFTLKESVEYFDSRLWTYLGDNYYYCTRGDMYDSSDNVILYKDEVLLELDKIDAFESARIQGVARMEYNGRVCFAVHLKSPSNVSFYSLIDDKGDVVISPTKDICFMHTYSENIGFYSYTRYVVNSFATGYCKAQDTETGLYGFIDITGSWVINPIYKSVSDLYEDSKGIVAIVNENTVIRVQNDQGRMEIIEILIKR